MKLNLLDLFSGIGGFHLGLEKAGFEVNAFNSEIDKYAMDVYKNNFKNSTYVGSVTNVQQKNLPKIDAITFGSPCQDFSVAGKRKGMQGSRSSLISEAIRLISECKPSFFIWENVKGTFSSNSGDDFWSIIQAFTNIGGYRLEWQLLNTSWFLPQNRERIYLVGYAPGQSRGQVFPIGQSVGKTKNEIDIIGNTKKGGQRGVIHSTKGIVSALSATDYKQPKQIKIKSNNSKGHDIVQIGDSLNYSNPSSKTRSGRVGKGVAQTLDTYCRQAVIGDYRNDEGYRQRANGNSPTLALRCGDDIIVNKIRKLTPIECERLQGFPDNWTQKGVNGPISDTQRYKMCGNAVTVDVVEAVAKQIIKNKYYERL
jgi:DNA (cytosine-5)-methyltransferase 1